MNKSYLSIISSQHRNFLFTLDYEGSCSHGGCAFAGKDPGKVDHSAAYGYFGRTDVNLPWKDIVKEGLI